MGYKYNFALRGWYDEQGVKMPPLVKPAPPLQERTTEWITAKIREYEMTIRHLQDMTIDGDGSYVGDVYVEWRGGDYYRAQADGRIERLTNHIAALQVELTGRGYGATTHDASKGVDRTGMVGVAQANVG